MFKNYLKIAFRNFRKNKIHSTINLLGLSVGMAVAILIALWVWDEFSFNTYHKNYDRIGRIMKRADSKGVGWVGKSLPYPMINALRTSYGRNFKHIVPATQEQEYILTKGDKVLSENGMFVGEDAPEMFTLKMLSGTWSGLKDPHSILLSASAAKAFFGDSDPLEKPMKLSDTVEVKVAGVYADLPQNTQFHAVSFFAPFELYLSSNPWVRTQGWDNNFLVIYTELQSNTDFEHASANIRDMELINVRNFPDFKQEVDDHIQSWVFPMSQWHLYANFKKGIADRGPIQFVWLVAIIGSFVLILACINFMNLSTARSEKRAREVGIRKVAGSARSQLIGQFFGESFLIVILAFVLSLLFVLITLPWFNDLAGKDISIPWASPWFWLSGLAFIFVTGILAGSYPALYLSSFKPVKVLKGSFRLGQVASIPRKILVVVQFVISICLIICTIIVYNQIVFAKDRPVGYSRDGLLMIEKKPGMSMVDYHILRTELINSGAVTEVSESGGPVTAVWSGNSGFDWRGKNPNITSNFATLAVTPEYGKTVGWKFVDGRDFSPTLVTDSAGFIVNEAAAKYMGLANPVGEIVHWDTRDYKAGGYKILGVINDMVMKSPFEPVEPTIFFLYHNLGWINIRINPSMSTGKALAKIEAGFKKLMPAAPFEYKFADEDYAKKFASEERIGKLAGFFAVLAIFISCLGLFGMASFVAEQRIKEIGVRKVLGASVFNIWGLLSKEFATLVIVALFIATPIAWFFMHSWLQNYQYRYGISWWVFVASGLGALIITLLTVSYQSITAALASPIKSLKVE